MRPKVFISYADEDRARAEILHEDLRRAGAEVFQFSQAAPVGTPSWGEILDRISAADVFIILVSEASNASRAVQAELEHAYGSRINTNMPERIIPAILQSGVRPTTFARGFTWLHFEDYEVGLRRLSRELGLSVEREDEATATRRNAYRDAMMEGVERAKRKDNEMALAAFKRATEIEPDSAFAYLSAGSMLIRAQRWDEALTYLDLALKHDPSLAIAHSARAEVLAKRGESRAALEAVRTAIDMEPANAAHRVVRSCVLEYDRRMPEALREAEEASRLNPESVDALNRLAYLHAQMGRDEDALAAAERALELDPASSFGHLSRGIVFASLGRYDESLRELERAIELDPDNVDALYDRGVALALLKRYDDALLAIEHAYRAGFTRFDFTRSHHYLEDMRASPTYGPKLRALIEQYAREA